MRTKRINETNWSRKRYPSRKTRREDRIRWRELRERRGNPHRTNDDVTSFADAYEEEWARAQARRQAAREGEQYEGDDDMDDAPTSLASVSERGLEQ